MRDRNLTVDQRYDTIALMQPGDLAWELALPNGTYTVRIIAGDPVTVAGRYRIDVEG